MVSSSEAPATEAVAGDLSAADEHPVPNNLTPKASPKRAGSISSVNMHESLNASNNQQSPLRCRKRTTSSNENNEDCELTEICHTQRSELTPLEGELKPANSSSNNHKDSFSRKKLWANAAVANETVEDDGCYNPSFSKSEPTVAIVVDRNEAKENGSQSNSASSSRPNSGKFKRTDTDSDIHTVL